MTGKIIGLDGKPLIRAQSAYEGASQRGRLSSWNAPAMGPNSALSYAAGPLRNRTRAGFRNSLLMRSAISKNTTSEVGKGFTLLSTVKDDETRREINRLWRISSGQLDPWGDLNFGAILHLAVMARRMSGEVFIRRLRRNLASGLEVPNQVELLESDMCPIDLNRWISPTQRIIQGVEFKGKLKVAYWFYKAHPNDAIDTIGMNQLERVPARDVIHHYMPTRPGQVRGEPGTTAVLVKDRTFHEYDDAELVRKKERSAFTGFLYREGGAEDWEFDPQTGKSLYGDDSDPYAQRESVAPGTMLRGAPGEKLELFDGDDTGSGYKDYTRWQSLMLAAGQEIPHAMLTGDWSGLNDRLVRAFMIEYRRGIGFEQTNLSGFQVAFGIWRWFIETAIITGKITAPGFSDDPWPWLELDIRPDAWKHLHPEQEVNARIKAVKAQTSNIEAEAAESGRDLEDNMRRNAKAVARWQQICKEEGVDNAGDLTGLFNAPDTNGSGATE
jgi:lambda family phage portal protein